MLERGKVIRLICESIEVSRDAQILSKLCHYARGSDNSSSTFHSNEKQLARFSWLFLKYSPSKYNRIRCSSMKEHLSALLVSHHNPPRDQGALIRDPFVVMRVQTRAATGQDCRRGAFDHFMLVSIDGVFER